MNFGLDDIKNNTILRQKIEDLYSGVFENGETEEVDEIHKILTEWADGAVESVVQDLKEEIECYIWGKANEIANEKRRKFKESCQLAKALYHEISDELIERKIKSELPLNVRLFNKVTVNGKILREDVITYTYYLNNNISHKFQYVPSLIELDKLLKK